MKITSLECFIVPPRWLFVKIATDEGIVGWGEPIVEGKARTVKAAVEELGEQLIGKNPLRIEDHWQMMYRSGFYRGGPILMSAIAGIDQALWDIKGKYYDAPVYELLGGACRDSVKVYSWIGGDRPSEVGEEASERKAAGFLAVKMNATEELQYIDSYKKIDMVLERVAAVREAVGDDFGIGIDFHGRVHKPMAKILAHELQVYRPMFIEEPVLPENNEALKEIAQATTIPIATGERMFSRWDFKDALASGSIAIIQPDLSHAGGITECRKIFAMAEAYDVAVAPHCPLGPIALAACLQVDAVSHNVFIQEQSLGIHYNRGNDLLDYLEDPTVFEYKDGFVEIPKGPGLGVVINEAFVRKQAEIGHNWKNPVWRHKDGTIAEW
ncbi:galactonate dehydratase [Caldibacillus lycopersici]|uniref:Galactonate dehydratase n=1 Tax=Perspicuibacillus lycopersici TaxID=1325689 RepID=A0AAE3ISX4_9BACI|nr:galactonate dehydratase [Perspicuibacillus lycopersici]MCU9613053.1 galactonate dehydratase [Perspicuibacillus lycopersici]